MKIKRKKDNTLTLYLDITESFFLPLDAHTVLDKWKEEFDEHPDAPMEFLQFSQEVIKFFEQEAKEDAST